MFSAKQMFIGCLIMLVSAPTAVLTQSCNDDGRPPSLALGRAINMIDDISSGEYTATVNSHLCIICALLTVSPILY